MIVVDRISIVQGAFRLENVSFAIEAGRYAVLMGRTGSGKTTVIEAIAGLRPVAAGRILLDGRDVTHLSPGERGVGYVPQDGALFPTMTVYDNLAFPLVIRHIGAKAIRDRVAELAGWLHIAHLLNRFPVGLSGGETQRIALGRALAFFPRILLLDEPLSALDEETRESLLEVLDALKRRREVSVLHVTHHRAEAERLADIMLRVEKDTVRPANTATAPPVAADAFVPESRT
jgi:molybdate/tungstate transport system ATP-binding protein